MMKTIGLIGGMSWESTAHYYSLLNRLVNRRLGGYEAAKLLLYSVNFADLHRLQVSEQWEQASALILDAGQRLEKGGADVVLICANTMHISAPELERSLKVPLLHIADAAAGRLLANGVRRVGLLGTAFTMEKQFYIDRLRKFELDVLIPDAPQRKVVHEIIFNELVRGIIRPESKAKYREIIDSLVQRKADAILLGCTELMMIIEPGDSQVPLFDTTAIHCEAAVDYALS